MTTKEPTSQHRFKICSTALTLLAVIVAAGLCAAATTASPSRAPAANLHVVSTTVRARSSPCAYSWPIKPFDRQHPVRSFLNDPRIGKKSAFHFGIDISAPDGTPLYAVEAGTVYRESPSAIAVLASDRSHSFGYWHIVPAVKHHQYVARHQLIGWIRKGWEHVHFAERRGGVYVNPLRPGGLGPYVDRTAPTVRRITVTRDVVVVDAFDTQSPSVPGAWRGEPVTPALLQWRIAGTSAWHTIADFRSVMLPASRFGEIYAPNTLQNHKGVPGRFCFYLARGSVARALDRPGCTIEVQAIDTAGNRTVVVWQNV